MAHRIDLFIDHDIAIASADPNPPIIVVDCESIISPFYIINCQ